MTQEERRERGKALCVTLVEDIAKVATPGLGLWPEAWELVAEQSADFMEELLRWEQTGDEVLVDGVRRAYDALVSAWQYAARLHDVRKVS